MLKTGATSKLPAVLVPPVSPYWSTPTVAPPLPSVSLLLFVMLPRKKLTRYVTMPVDAGSIVKPNKPCVARNVKGARKNVNGKTLNCRAGSRTLALK